MCIHKALAFGLLVATAFSVGTAAAGTLHAVAPAEMQAAIAARVDDRAAQRAAIQSLLARPEVRKLAANSGLDLARAKAVAANLDGPELQHLAAQSRAADAQLAGGDSIVIGTTTLLLILILIVLLVR